MRGDDLPDEPPPAAKPVRPAQSAAGTIQPGSALAALTAATGINPPATTSTPIAAPAAEPVPARTALDLDDRDAVDEAAHQLLDDLKLSVKLTAKDHILAVLGDLYPEPLTSDQIGEELTRREVEITRTYRQDVLKRLREEGSVRQERENGPYSLPPK
jgi:hypothetical protein